MQTNFFRKTSLFIPTLGGGEYCWIAQYPISHTNFTEKGMQHFLQCITIFLRRPPAIEQVGIRVTKQLFYS